MELGMIGLGRMGGNMARRLISKGYRIVAYNSTPGPIVDLVKEGGIKAASPGELVGILSKPRVVWLMIPAGKPIDETIELLLPNLSEGDMVIDGGNSYYKDSMRRGQYLAEKKIHFVDVGTSGGIWGLTEGYSLMIGGTKEAVERLRPIFETLAPAPDKGWGHVGPSGAGHFVKMVHNGIEYGMMQALAEGFAILEAKKEFSLDLHQISENWRYGSVVRSWLLDLTALVFAEDQKLEDIAPYVADSGEGRWTTFEAIDLNVPAPIITQSLIQRLRSQDDRDFIDRILAAMRHQFGGHAIKAEKK
jgi:6-phosphogluconate dehydrogenase